MHLDDLDFCIDFLYSQINETSTMILQEAAGSQIEFHVSTSSEIVHQALSTSLVQWHMTGADSDTSLDPASEEHFGISIVEGEI